MGRDWSETWRGQGDRRSKGSQHFEDKGIEYDAERTYFLEGYGLAVIRIPNNEVNRNFRAVCEYIAYRIGQSISQLR